MPTAALPTSIFARRFAQVDGSHYLDLTSPPGCDTRTNAAAAESAFVFIVSDESATTDVFVTTGPEQLSYENGLIVYLAQTAHLGEYTNRQIPVVDGPASCGRDDVSERRALIERATKQS